MEDINWSFYISLILGWALTTASLLIARRYFGRKD